LGVVMLTVIVESAERFSRKRLRPSSRLISARRAEKWMVNLYEDEN
jgi:hypothetical protein